MYSLRVSLKSILTIFHLPLFLLRVPEVLGLKVSNTHQALQKCVSKSSHIPSNYTFIRVQRIHIHIPFPIPCPLLTCSLHFYLRCHVKTLRYLHCLCGTLYFASSSVPFAHPASCSMHCILAHIPFPVIHIVCLFIASEVHPDSACTHAGVSSL